MFSDIRDILKIIQKYVCQQVRNLFFFCALDYLPITLTVLSKRALQKGSQILWNKPHLTNKSFTTYSF